MCDTLEENNRTVSISVKSITNLHFVNGIKSVTEERMETLIKYIGKSCTSHKIDTSAYNFNLYHTTKGIKRKITIKGKTVGTMTCCRYLGNSYMRLLQGLHRQLQPLVT